MEKLYVVATPIGNLNDISKRALDTLNEVDLILCEDTRHSLKLLNYYNIKKPLLAYHKFNEQEKASSYLEKIKNGQSIALITDAGTPCISDPGYIIVKKAHEENIPVIAIGGISALISALSVSGLDTKSFTFYGFFPRENKEKETLIKSIKESDVPLSIFYESPKRIIKTMEYLKNSLGNIKVSLSSELTKIHEKTSSKEISSVLKELKETPENILGEYTLIIETEKEKEESKSLSIEASLIDIIIKEKVSLKEAINLLNENNKSLSKKDIYNASLHLKEIIN